MLKNLVISNFTIIDYLEVSFGKGLNVLTGETGAGKSIIIDAIDLVFGSRSSKEQIKTGENKAIIELTLELNEPIELLEENGIELEQGNILIISREISQTGTRSRINGILVTQNFMQSLREHLIDIHSQNETYRYIQPKTHIGLLDAYGHFEHRQKLENYKEIYSQYRKTLAELENISNEMASREQRTDFLSFQINEIESAKLESIDEYDNLINERLILLNSEELKNITLLGYASLYDQEGSIIDILNQIENNLIKGAEFDPMLGDLAETISSNSHILRDIANELRKYSDNMETDEQRLADIEERIEILDKIKRKYGPALSDALANLEKFSSELSEIEIKTENQDKLKEKLNLLKQNLENQAKELSNSRIYLAEELSGLVQRELTRLEMPRALFQINIEPKNELSADGGDQVEFFITTNPGEPLKPLAKIASGGEVSRVMLALKTVFARADRVNTVIFDEIDTGISGKTSQSVAEALAGLSCNHQIVCITHQPIIAAMADEYFHISKIQEENRSRVLLRKLEGEEKVKAISRLASGSDESMESIIFAEKLIKEAVEYRQGLLNSKVLS